VALLPRNRPFAARVQAGTLIGPATVPAAGWSGHSALFFFAAAQARRRRPAFYRPAVRRLRHERRGPRGPLRVAVTKPKPSAPLNLSRRLRLRLIPLSLSRKRRRIGLS